MEKYNNFSEVIEVGDHFKNGASSKNHSGRENFRIILTLKIILLALIFTCTAYAQRNTTVTGYIKGLTNDTVMIMLVPLDNLVSPRPVYETIFAKNGRFTYTFTNNKAYLLSFRFAQFFVYNRPMGGGRGGLFTPTNSGVAIFTEPDGRGRGRIIIEGSINLAGLNDITVSGSKLNSDFSTIQNKMFEININEAEEEMALEQAAVDKNEERHGIGWANRRKTGFTF